MTQLLSVQICSINKYYCILEKPVKINELKIRISFEFQRNLSKMTTVFSKPLWLIFCNLWWQIGWQWQINVTQLFTVPTPEVFFPFAKGIHGSDTNWGLIFLFIFQECFIAKIHTVYLLKPDGFWERSRVSFGSSKLLFEVKYWNSTKLYYSDCDTAWWNFNTLILTILPQDTLPYINSSYDNCG